MTNDNRSALVSCEWIAGRLDTAGIILLDATFFLPNQARNARDEFQNAHIPGARFFDIDVIADVDSRLPHMLPDAEHFSEAAGQLGINNQTKVIVYDNNSFMASARAWWTFRVFGHHDIAVLDGGLARWKALSAPLTSEMSPAKPCSFSAQWNQHLVCTLERMRALSEKTTSQILDARSLARFSGSEPEPRAGVRPGHIPGSRHLHYATLVDPDTHTLRPVEALRGLYRQSGIMPDQPIVTTCGSGVTAAILALGLYCLGRHDVPVYDGSWTEWGAQEDTPVATGS